MKQRDSETEVGRRSGATAFYQLPSYLTAIPAPSGGHSSLRTAVAAHSPLQHIPSPPAPTQPALSATEATSPTFSLMDYYSNSASSLSSPAKFRASRLNHNSLLNTGNNSRPSLDRTTSTPLGMSPTNASAFSSHFSRPYVSGSQWGTGARFADSDDDEDDDDESESESEEEEDEEDGGNHPHTQLELSERDTAETGAITGMHHTKHFTNSEILANEGRRLDVVDDSKRASLEPTRSWLPGPTHTPPVLHSPAAASSSADINENSSDDEAPLGVVAAQFKHHRQAAKSPAAIIRVNSWETPPAILPSEEASISNLLNTIAANGKSAGDLDNLEGLVGALNDLIVKKRKEEQQQQQQLNVVSKPPPMRQQTYPPSKAAAPASDSEDDDKPLAQIQKAALEDPPSSKTVARAAPISYTAMSRTTNKSTAPSLKPRAPFPEPQQEPQQRAAPNTPQIPTSTAAEPVASKKITIRIYLDIPLLTSPYKTVILTNQLTADMVVDQLLALLEAGAGGDFVDNGTWTLFEVCADFGVERPLRDWEIVTDVVEAWLDGNGGLLPGDKGGGGEDSNRLWLKSYGFRNTLVPRCIIGKWPKVEGRFDMEVKPGKWKRRYFVLREDAIYYKDRESDTRENILCKLNNFDVYTLLQARKRAPTRYCFALRSTASLTVFEKADEYAHYFCVDNQTQMVDWVLGIRLAKNECMFAEYPDMFTDYDNVPARSKPRLKSAIASAAVTSQQQQQALTRETISAAAVAADQEPFIPATSLLGQSLAKKRELAPAMAPPQPGKPLLSFPNTNFQLVSNPADLARTKSKRASGGVPPAATTPNAPKRDFFNNEPAVALLDHITEAADMWRPGAAPVDNSRPYDDAYVQDVLVRLDRAWEFEQQQAAALVDAVRNGVAAVAVPGDEAATRQGPKRDSAPPLARSKTIGVPGSHTRRKSVEAVAAALACGSATLGRSVGRPLIDVSDSKNCLTCGCSEFKSVYTHAGGVLNRDGKRVCGNCRHAHK